MKIEEQLKQMLEGIKTVRSDLAEFYRVQIEAAGQMTLPPESLRALEWMIAQRRDLESRYLDMLKDIAATEQQRQIEDYRAWRADNLEGLRSLTSYAQSALKASMLINGGGAVALLAFTGRLIERATPGAVSLAFPMALFCAGVLAAAIGTLFSYLTQYAYLKPWKKAAVFHAVAFLLVAVSFGSFAWGMIEAYLVFRILKF